MNERERERERKSKSEKRERKYLNWQEEDERLEKSRENESQSSAGWLVGLLFSLIPRSAVYTHIYTRAHTYSLSISLTAELKMEILRERELRESIEKQMMEDQRSRGKLFATDYFPSGFIFEYQLFTESAIAQLSSYTATVLIKKKASPPTTKSFTYYTSAL